MHFANEAPINPRPAIMIFVTLECPSFPFSQDVFCSGINSTTFSNNFSNEASSHGILGQLFVILQRSHRKFFRVFHWLLL